MKHDFERPRRKAVALDPHPLCHTALSTLLARFNIELVGAATSARTAQTLLQEHNPDLLVMEIELAEGRDAALELISDSRGALPGLTVIVLSGTNDCALIDAALDRGSSAYVLKTSDPEAIATAIRQAFEPSIYLARPQEHPEPAKENDVLHKLTRRELEILQLVSGGRSNREVAEILWVADQTVKFHLANVYRKLGVGNRFEAARWARESGILDVVVEPDSTLPTSEGSGNGGVTRALVPLRSPRPKKAKGRLEETSR